MIKNQFCSTKELREKLPLAEQNIIFNWTTVQEASSLCLCVYLLCSHMLGPIDAHRHGCESWRLPWVWHSSCSSLLLSAGQQSSLGTPLGKGNPGSPEHRKEKQVHRSRNVLVFSMWTLHLHAQGLRLCLRNRKLNAVLTWIWAGWLRRKEGVTKANSIWLTQSPFQSSSTKKK